MNADHPLQNERGAEGGSPDATVTTATTARECDSCPVSLVWVFAWLGTIAAGGVFGIMGGGLAGLVFGPIFAGVVGIPIHITMATVTWLLWLSRFSTAMSGIAGAMTGTAATLLVWEPFFPLPLSLSIVLAALLGGLGGALGAGLCRARSTRPTLVPGSRTESRWQSSLRDLLVRVTVVAGLISGWTWFCVSVYDARSPVSEAELRSRFQQHRAEFDRLAGMFRQDEQLDTIFRDGSYDDAVIDRQRGAEYLAALRRARLSNSMVFSTHDGETHRIQISPDNAFRADMTMGYVYTTEEPENIVERLADGDADRLLGPGESEYANLGDHWYLFNRRLDDSD